MKNHSAIYKILMMCLIGSFSIPNLSFADEIVEIPAQELPRESVYPVFDHPQMVKSRNVVFENKIEVSANVGTSVNEAFVDQILYGVMATYHLSNVHAGQLYASGVSSQASSYTGQLDREVTQPLNYSLIPKPKYFILGAYEITPFYGKMSITKQTVMNLSTYGTIGGGLMGLGDTNSWLLGLGLGQNFFFGSHWGLKLDMRGLIYNGINPVSYDHRTSSSTPSVADYERTLTMNISVTLGLLYLL